MRRRAALLAGVRVVGIEQAVAAPLCTRQLADLGADVIKIERPGAGDFARHYDQAVDGLSAHFVWLNRGKRSVALDLKDVRGVAALHSLLDTSDVLVCNLAAGATERLLDDEALAARNPRLVRCYLTGYGQTGPARDRKAFDAIVQAEAGVISATGTSGSPAKAGVSIADIGAGITAFGAINAALVDRERTGLGCRIDISLFDVLVEWMMPLLLTRLHGGDVPPPAGAHHATIAPYGPYPTSDGTVVMIAVQNDGQWLRLCETLLGDARLATHASFATNADRVRNRGELDRLVEAETTSRSSATVEALLDVADIPWGRVNDLDAVIDHPQLRERSRWMRAPDARVTGVPDPIFVDGLAGELGPVPQVGEHTAEVLRSVAHRSIQT